MDCSVCLLGSIDLQCFQVLYLLLDSLSVLFIIESEVLKSSTIRLSSAFWAKQASWTGMFWESPHMTQPLKFLQESGTAFGLLFS